MIYELVRVVLTEYGMYTKYIFKPYLDNTNYFKLQFKNFKI